MKNLIWKENSNTTHETQTWNMKTLLGDLDYIDLNPPYQRGLVWTIDQKKSLINTVLLDFPMQTLFFAKNKKCTKYEYECVDGKQRISTFNQFFTNKFYIQIDKDVLTDLATYHHNVSQKNKNPISKAGNKLRNLIWTRTFDEKIFGTHFKLKENDKYYYKNLPTKLKRTFSGYKVHILILQGMWNRQQINDIFQRVQNGSELTLGELLNSQNHFHYISLLQSRKNELIKVFSRLKLPKKNIERCGWLTVIISLMSILRTKDIQYCTHSKILSYSKILEYKNDIEINSVINFLNKLSSTHCLKKIDYWDLLLITYASIKSNFNQFLYFYINCEKSSSFTLRKRSRQSIKNRYKMFQEYLIKNPNCPKIKSEGEL